MFINGRQWPAIFLLLLPVSVVSNECNIFKMKIVKNYLRNAFKRKREYVLI